MKITLLYPKAVKCVFQYDKMRGPTFSYDLTDALQPIKTI